MCPVLCLFGPFFLRWREEATRIFTEARKIKFEMMPLDVQLTCISNLIRRHIPKTPFPVNYAGRLDKVVQVSTLLATFWSGLLIVIPTTDTGKSNHAVAVTGDYLFDGTCDRALALSQKALVYAVGGSTVVGIKRCLHFKGITKKWGDKRKT